MVKLFVIILMAVVVCQRGGQAANIKINNDLNNEIDSPNEQMQPNSVKNFIELCGTPPIKVAHGIGETVSLTCEALGSPAPTIRWLKNNEPIHDYNPETNYILDAPSQSSIAKVYSTLFVSTPSKNLEDVYTCVITAGPVVQKSSTTVFTADSNTELAKHALMTPQPPTIVYTYKALMDVMGSNVVIPCRARGHPHANVYWKDNNGILVTRRNRRMRVLRNGELVIRNIRWADMGDYHCIATNSAGTVTSITFVYPFKAG